jgi:WD40 repeat protein
MVNIWSPASSTSATLSYNANNVLRTVAWNNAGAELAIGGDDKMLTLLNANTGGVLKNSSAFLSRVQAVSWSTNDAVVYIGTYGNGVHAFDVNSGKTNFNKDIFLALSKVYTLEVSPDGQMAAVGINDGTVYLVDINDGWNANATIRSNSFGSALSLSWSSDSSLLAVGYSNNVAIVYDVATQNQQYQLSHNSSVNALAWKPNDTTTLATGSNDNHVTVWKLASGNVSSTLFTGHTGPVMSMAWGTGGLVSGSKDTKIILWNA